MSKILASKKHVIAVLAGLLLFLFFQNCGNVDLHKKSSASSSFSSNINMQLRPPTEFAWNRRYVFLVDMSYSMVSGPCPFDVNVSDSTHGFSSQYNDYDPNFQTDLVDFRDARARVSDCSVDRNLNHGQMQLDYSQPNNSSYLPDHKTFKGGDFEGNRFEILRTWIEQMRNSNNSEFLERTEILMIPAAGGVAFDRLFANYPLKNLRFIKLSDKLLDDSLAYLEDIHKDTADRSLIRASQRFEEFDPDLEALEMGTTSLVFAYDKIFNITDVEMEKLANAGSLTHSSFKLFSFGDSRVTPLDAQIVKALSYMNPCVDCRGSLETAWGKKQDNELETLDLKLSLIQGLTKYYGSGFFDADFFDMQSLLTPKDIRYFADIGTQTLVGTEFPVNQRNVIEFLDQRSSARKASTKIYKIANSIPPYRIANNNSGITTFKMTHVFILNSNFKVDFNGRGLLDSDGDGLPDELEALYGLNPVLNPEKARTNDICLDILMVEPAYKARCESLYNSRLCSPQLDSDGDGLSECEEMTIATDPFDFDTDGDGIPDSIEVLYSLNPLLDDSKSDSNGDGLTNIMNLAKGLNPLVLPSQVLAADQINILLNFISQQQSYSELLGNVKSDLFQLALLNFPMKTSALSPQALSVSYLLRPGSRGFSVTSQIPVNHQLIKPISVNATNKLFALIRVIDPDEPQRVYWETFEIDLATDFASSASNIDLSKLSQLKVIDRVRLVK